MLKRIAASSLLGIAFLASTLSAQTCTVSVELRFYSFADDPIPEIVTNVQPDAEKARSLYVLTAEHIGQFDWKEAAKHKFSSICLNGDHPDYFVLWKWLPRNSNGALGASTHVFRAGDNGCVVVDEPIFQSDEYGKDLERTTKEAFKKTLQFLAVAQKSVAPPNKSCVSIETLLTTIKSAKASGEAEVKGSLTDSFSQTAEVEISSTPSGADIELDGSFVGNTPSSLNISPGKHVITITKQGYKSWKREAKITTGKISIVAELERSQE